MQRHRTTFKAMAAEHEITLDAPSAAAANAALDAAIADVLRIEAKYSRYRDDSVTSRINRAAGVQAVDIDDETTALLHYADECHRLSGGRFDITSGVLRRAWDFRATPPRLPTREALDALLPLIGWSRVEFDGKRIRLPLAGMEIDFGGIGKEYAADRAAAILTRHGIAHALVNLGGDIRAIGGQADGMAWRIGIRHPRATPISAIASVDVRDGAVATSGDYERYFEIDGRRYCHLLDPRTGMPAAAWQSISVVAPLAIVAGSYSTIAMLLGTDAPAFLSEHGVGWLGIDAGGTLHDCLAA